MTFLPSSIHLLLANISNRYLRLFDLRAPSIPAMKVVTKLCGIAADPLDPHRIASFGDSAVTIWDVRKIMQLLLSYFPNVMRWLMGLGLNLGLLIPILSSRALGEEHSPRWKKTSVLGFGRIKS